MFNENVQSGRYIFSQLSTSPSDFETIAKEFQACMGSLRTKSLLIDVVDTINKKEYMPSGKSPIRSVVLSQSAKGITSLYVYFNLPSAGSTEKSQKLLAPHRQMILARVNKK